MFQTVIAVLIGMMFLYFVLAVLCSGVKEFISAKFELRSKNLEKAIGRMLANETSNAASNAAKPAADQAKPAAGAELGNLVSKFYDHPLIKGLGDENRKPSYIPTQYFSSVLEQILKLQQGGGDGYKTLIDNLPEGTLKQKLSTLAASAGAEAGAIRKEVEQWFDSTMNRASGWYKRQTHTILLAIAFVLVTALNADSFAVFRSLWQNSTLRDSVVAAAQNAKADMTTDQAKHQLSDLQELPLGWKSRPSWGGIVEAFSTSSVFLWWLLKLCGLAVTAYATTLGAPFWFDAMNKLINLRLSGSTPQAGASQPQPTSTVVIQTEGARAVAAKA